MSATASPTPPPRVPRRCGVPRVRPEPLVVESHRASGLAVAGIVHVPWSLESFVLWSPIGNPALRFPDRSMDEKPAQDGFLRPISERMPCTVRM
jgi:hypothetical protein